MRDGTAGRTQLCGFLVARVPPSIGGLAAPGSRGRLGAVRCGRDHGRHEHLFADLLGSTPNRGVLAIDNGADRITKVA